MARIGLLLLALCLWTVHAGAQPSISGVLGELNSGNDILISGDGFGSNGPEVLLFDDFESGVNQSPIATGNGSAEYGNWNTTSGLVTYSNYTAVSGSLAFRADQSTTWLNYVEALLPEGTMDVFVSWWLYIPSTDNLPGEGTPDGINWKQMWIQGSGSDDDDQVTPSLSPQYWMWFGNHTPYYGGYPSIPYMAKGQWKHFKVWIKGGYSNDGQVRLWHLGHTGDLDIVTSDNNVTTMYPGGIRERVRINGYGRRTANCHPTFDDVYIATGANAQARVEIGNHPSYLSCSKIAISVPTAWDNDLIAAKLYTGSIPPGTAYLFVIDSAGNVSGGHEITIGGGSGDLGTPGQPGKPVIQ